ncbi:MAG: epoxyqueuosine reductase [Anaerolineae bacterium]|nr:epoxyqueuosine reductase [Anaerolineae bacterium]
MSQATDRTLTQRVKEHARQHGADLVGVASMDRFEGAPKQMDPRYIFPDAKAVLVFGFRIPRGTLRGIEEGTFFYVYSSLGYAGINVVQQPVLLWSVAAFLEDEGWEAVPIPNHLDWENTGKHGKDPVVHARVNEAWSRPVSADKPAPDVFIHLRIAAFCAGLGEIGYSKLLLTPEFGPRQRLAAMLTDAPLEPDPLFEGELCDRCMLCVRDCTGRAISPSETIKVTVAGRQLEWGRLDHYQCSRYFCGASREHNPFMVSAEDERGFTQEVSQAQQYKLTPAYGYGRALEGARGCIRACMVHLEETGKLNRSFHNRFRSREPWRLER